MAHFSQSLIQIVTLLILISVLVVVHEWGHFIVSRLFGIRVDDFSVGMGPRIWRIGKLGDTEYNVRLLPIGGFVRIVGMDADEQSLRTDRVRQSDDDPDADALPLVAENTPDAVAYDGPDGFNKKPVWQRALVILAGPVMSFVLGYVIFCLLGVTLGVPSGPATTTIAVVLPEGEGHRIGLQAGDVITAVDGVPMRSGPQLVQTVHSSIHKALHLRVRRGSATLNLVGTPGAKLDDNHKPVSNITVQNPGALAASFGLQPGDVIEGIDEFALSSAAQVRASLAHAAGTRVQLDVVRAGEPKQLAGAVPPAAALATLETQEKAVGVLDFYPQSTLVRCSLGQSFHVANLQIVGIFSQLFSIIKQHKLAELTGGAIVIYQATGIAVHNGLVSVLTLAAQISISLAVFNILPIPLLDGGHLFMFLVEFLRGGRRLTQKQQTAWLYTGLVLIGTLFLWRFSLDVIMLVKHRLPQ